MPGNIRITRSSQNGISERSRRREKPILRLIIPAGYLFCQDTFYVGTIKSLGRIYQQAWVDAYSNFGLAKVYLDKKADSAIDFVKTKVIPTYELFQIPLDRILTDNGKEYTTHWKNGKHAYETFLTESGIRHTRIKPRTPRSNGMVEGFNRTLLEEFYQIAMIKNIYTSLMSYRMIWISLLPITILKERIRVTG